MKMYICQYHPLVFKVALSWQTGIVFFFTHLIDVGPCLHLHILNDLFFCVTFQIAKWSLWDIRLVIFVKTTHVNKIGHIKQSVVKTGIANTLGKSRRYYFVYFLNIVFSLSLSNLTISSSSYSFALELYLYTRCANSVQTFERS